MTGPKHLWSGNWQEESIQPAAAPPEPVRRADSVPPGPPPVRRARLPAWRLLAPAAAVILVAAIALAELLPTGSSGPRRRTATAPTVSAVPSPPPFTTPAPATTSPNSTSGNTISGHPVTWLGMEISTENGTSVIQTVQLGSPADAAGLNPGDVIQTVNGHPISAAEQIRTAVRNLRPGDAVQISVVRGSTFFTTVADFAGQPTTSP